MFRASQELQQVKQQSVLNEIKKQVGDVKLASKNKLTDYQVECSLIGFFCSCYFYPAFPCAV
jgi:hypothetical protein